MSKNKLIQWGKKHGYIVYELYKNENIWIMSKHTEVNGWGYQQEIKVIGNKTEIKVTPSLDTISKREQLHSAYIPFNNVTRDAKDLEKMLNEETRDDRLYK